MNDNNEDLITKILVKDDTIRYAAFEKLIKIAENNPKNLYPYWDKFAELLSSKNQFDAKIGMDVCALLSMADTEGKTKNILPKLRDLLYAERMMNVGHAALNLGRIAQRKPEISEEVFSLLVDESQWTVKHRDLVKAYIIESFMYFYEISSKSLKNKIEKWIQSQSQNNNAKVKKIIKDFRSKYKID